MPQFRSLLLLLFAITGLRCGRKCPFRSRDVWPEQTANPAIWRDGPIGLRFKALERVAGGKPGPLFLNPL
jgi:hypothetical protein